MLNEPTVMEGLPPGAITLDGVAGVKLTLHVDGETAELTVTPVSVTDVALDAGFVT